MKTCRGVPSDHVIVPARVLAERVSRTSEFAVVMSAMPAVVTSHFGAFFTLATSSGVSQRHVSGLPGGLVTISARGEGLSLVLSRV
jgi:hypothetical protein